MRERLPLHFRRVRGEGGGAGDALRCFTKVAEPQWLRGTLARRRFLAHTWSTAGSGSTWRTAMYECVLWSNCRPVAYGLGPTRLSALRRAVQDAARLGCLRRRMPRAFAQIGG